MRMSELKRKEVINVCDCRRLGFVGDMEFDPCTGQIKALAVSAAFWAGKRNL